MRPHLVMMLHVDGRRDKQQCLLDKLEGPTLFLSAHVVTNKMTSLSLPGYPDSNLRNVNEMKLGCIASENG